MIIKWCDVCFLETHSSERDEPGLKLEATQSFALSAAEGDTKRPSLHVLDVCDVHAKPFLDLVQLMTELPLIEKTPTSNASVAQLPPSKRPAAVRHPSPSNMHSPCPVCQRTMARSSISAHVWREHRHQQPPKPAQGNCPECGLAVASGVALGQHRRHEHGWDSLIEALSGVKGYTVTGKERDWR